MVIVAMFFWGQDLGLTCNFPTQSPFVGFLMFVFSFRQLVVDLMALRKKDVWSHIGKF